MSTYRTVLVLYKNCIVQKILYLVIPDSIHFNRFVINSVHVFRTSMNKTMVRSLIKPSFSVLVGCMDITLRSQKEPYTFGSFRDTSSVVFFVTFSIRIQTVLDIFDRCQVSELGSCDH